MNRAAPARASRRSGSSPPIPSAFSASSSETSHWAKAEARSARRQTWGKAAIWAARAWRGGERLARRDHAVGQAQLSASAASTARPVRIMSSARPWPTSRGSRTVPPSISGTPQRRQNTPKIALVRRHPQVAPQGQLQPAGHGVALDGGDHRLGEQPPRRPHRTFADRIVALALAGGGDGQVEPGAERAARPGQHGDGGFRIGLEGVERRPQLQRRVRDSPRCASPGG